MRLLLVVIALIFSGCSTVYIGNLNVSKNYTLEKDDEKKGVVFGTIFLKDGKKSFLEKMGNTIDKYVIYLRPVGQDKKRSYVSSRGLSNKLEFGKDIGRLFAIKLEPGEYEFFSWHTSVGYGQFYGEPHFSKTFKVEAGKVQYLGEIVVHFITQSSMLGTHTIVGSRVMFSDKRDRDIGLFRSGFPGLGGDEIEFISVEEAQFTTETRSHMSVGGVLPQMSIQPKQ
jgi:hypothetical protein